MIKRDDSTFILMTCTKKVLLLCLSGQKEALCRNHPCMTQTFAMNVSVE